MAAEERDDTVIEIKGDLGRIEEEFQCSLCLERLQQPKILPCYHSFCEGCLEAWHRRCGDGLVCPECRTETVCNAVGSLPDDFRAKSVLENIPTTDSKVANHLCTSCEYNVTSSCGCLECDDYLCKECQFAHRRLRVTRDHQVLAYKDYNIQSKLSKLMKKAEPKGLLFTFGGYGANIGQLNHPSSVAVYKKTIYVSDLNGVHAYDEDGQFISTTGLDELIPTSFFRRPLMWNRNFIFLHYLYLVPEIVNLAFLSDGRMVYSTSGRECYVSEAVVFGGDNLSRTKFGGNILKQPHGVAVNSNDEMFIVDSQLGCVFCFNSDCLYQKKIACKGDGEGQLWNPAYVAVNAKDEIFVSDLVKRGPYWHRLIKIFDKRGYFIRQFTTSQFLFQNPLYTYRNYSMWEACQIQVNTENMVSLVDPESGLVQLYDDRGRFVRSLTKKDGIKYPRCLVLMGDRRLVCTDLGDHCVRVYIY